MKMTTVKINDVAKVYPFTKVNGLFDRKQKKLALEKQKAMPYTTNEGVLAVQHFSLTIDEGKFVVLLGPSGSGKSTVLRMIAGLEDVSVGEIYFNDELMNGVKPEDRDVAMVFQNYSLYPNQTVYENLSFPLKNMHMEQAELDERVNEIAKLLHIETKLGKLPFELSGGEKQRVAIARALVRKPRLFLLDEPFSNLDVLLRYQLRKEIKRIQKELGITFIYVTHDQTEAMYLADQLVIMKDGIIVQKGDVSTLYNYPKDEFVASFLGLIPMNIFKGIPMSSSHEITILNHKFRFPKIKEKYVDVGIRPTNIRLSQNGTQAIVEYTETIGADLVVHLRTEEEELCATEKIVSEDVIKYNPGDYVDIHFDIENIFLFNTNQELIN